VTQGGRGGGPRKTTGLRLVGQMQRGGGQKMFSARVVPLSIIVEFATCTRVVGTGREPISFRKTRKTNSAAGRSGEGRRGTQ